MIWYTKENALHQGALIALICYNVLILLIISLQYIFIKRRINHSVSGPLSNQSPQPTIIKPIYYFYMLMILIQITSVISLISGLWTNGEIFLFGGNFNFIFLWVSILVFITVDKIRQQFLFEKFETQSTLQPYMILSVSVVIFQTYFEISRFIFVTKTAVIVLLMYSFISNWNQFKQEDKENKLASERLNLFSLMDLVIILLLSSYFMIDYLEMRGAFIDIEYYLIISNLFVILISTLLLLIIYVPSWFRSVLGISEKVYRNNLDYRFDYNWNISQRKIEPYPKNLENNQTNQTKYLLAYINKDDEIILKELNDTYEGKIIHISQLDEQTLKMLGLPNHDVLFIDSNYSSVTQEFLKYIKNTFYFDISFKNHKLIIDQKYEIRDDNYKYSLLMIYPPNWNITRKLWHVLFPGELSIVMVQFLKQYKDFFEKKSLGQVIIAIIRFPVKQGRILPIPPSNKDKSAPNKDYVRFL